MTERVASSSRRRRLALWAAIASLVGLGLWFFGFQHGRVPTPPADRSATSDVPGQELLTPSVPSPAPIRRVYAQAVAGAALQFQFSAQIPAGWQAEAVPEVQALNLYDPAAPGSSNLEKSQLFIRYFTANRFLTLSTVMIHERSDLTVGGRPAVRYVIEKKPGVPDFPSQPSWRNQRHAVTDVRVADTDPSTFYVFGQRPDLDPMVTAQFFESLRVTEFVRPPVAGFRSRITKKPFGIHITPENSPVQPERFSGYHTGVDVEYADVAGPVPVNAIAAGAVIEARRVSGYGGAVAIRHTIADSVYVAIYGHLDPANLPIIGSQVTIGQVIGELGDDQSAETDGERKHLHFGLVKGTALDLRGYVASATELAGWADPLTIVAE